MLNQIETMLKVKSLLDDYLVYRYSTDDLFEEAIEEIANEVYLTEMLKIVTSVQYGQLQNKSINSYDNDDKLLFYAECYFIASKFLEVWSLKNETELQKTSYDYTTKIKGEEKSGKLYTSKQYREIAFTNLNNIDPYYGKTYSPTKISIARY